MQGPGPTYEENIRVPLGMSPGQPGIMLVEFLS